MCRRGCSCGAGAIANINIYLGKVSACLLFLLFFVLLLASSSQSESSGLIRQSSAMSNGRKSNHRRIQLSNGTGHHSIYLNYSLKAIKLIWAANMWWSIMTKKELDIVCYFAATEEIEEVDGKLTMSGRSRVPRGRCCLQSLSHFTKFCCKYCLTMFCSKLKTR